MEYDCIDDSGSESDDSSWECPECSEQLMNCMWDEECVGAMMMEGEYTGDNTAYWNATSVSVADGKNIVWSHAFFLCEVLYGLRLHR